MRRAALKRSELIQSIDWKDGNMEVKYRDDGALFVYFAVPFSVYKALKRSKNPEESPVRVLIKNRSFNW